MADLGKDIEMARYEAGMDRSDLAPSEAKKHRLASEINGVRERSEGADINQMAAIDRADDTSGRDMSEAKRLKNRLYEE